MYKHQQGDLFVAAEPENDVVVLVQVVSVGGKLVWGTPAPSLCLVYVYACRDKDVPRGVQRVLDAGALALPPVFMRDDSLETSKLSYARRFQIRPCGLWAPHAILSLDRSDVVRDEYGRVLGGVGSCLVRSALSSAASVVADVVRRVREGAKPTRDPYELDSRKTRWEFPLADAQKLYPLDPSVPAPEFLTDPPPPRPATGTLIKFTLNKSTSLLGRVIRDDANLWGLGDDYIVYIYKPECKPTPKCKVPGPELLLLPPMIISDEGWRFGKFKTLRVEPVGPDEALPRHLFASSTSSTGYVDHTGAETAKPAATPQLHIGTWEHTFVSMITERAAAALGVPAEAPAPPPPPAVRPGVTLYIDMESGVADTPLDRGEIADELADALGDLAELGDEGTNLATGEMEIEFDGTKVAAIEKKILSTLKRMGITKGVRVVAGGGRRTKA
jgi:hypothetical protein